MILSEAVSRARWVEAEAVRLKQMGLSFGAIAQQITRVGRGQAQAITPIPDGVSFTPDYHISRQACHKACRKAIAREPALGVEELRKIDHARSEEMWMNLQPAIRKGSPRAIEVGIKVLDHTVKVNGYGAVPQRPNESGTLGEAEQISVELMRKIVGDYKPVEPTSPPQRLVPAVEKDPTPSASGAVDEAVTTWLPGGPYSIDEIRKFLDK